MVTEAPPAPGTDVQAPPPVPAPLAPLTPPTDGVAPLTPPVAAAPETPAPQPIVEAPIPAATPEQQRLIQLEARELALNQQQKMVALETEYRTYLGQLETQYGMAPEQAKTIADTAFTPRAAAINQEGEALAKAQAVAFFSAKYKVPVSELSTLSTPESMELRAGTSAR